MDKVTLKALQESIAHWYRLSTATTIEEITSEGYGRKSCPLCAIFNANYESKEDCDGCPVAEATGVAYCVGSPYALAEISLDWEKGGFPREEYDQSTIDAEIRFLESLLPKGD